MASEYTEICFLCNLEKHNPYKCENVTEKYLNGLYHLYDDIIRYYLNEREDKDKPQINFIKIDLYKKHLVGRIKGRNINVLEGKTHDFFHRCGILRTILAIIAFELKYYLDIKKCPILDFESNKVFLEKFYEFINEKNEKINSYRLTQKPNLKLLAKDIKEILEFPKLFEGAGAEEEKEGVEGEEAAGAGEEAAGAGAGAAGAEEEKLKRKIKEVFESDLEGNLENFLSYYSENVLNTNIIEMLIKYRDENYPKVETHRNIAIDIENIEKIDDEKEIKKILNEPSVMRGGNIEMDYYEKYVKYKSKYLALKM